MPQPLYTPVSGPGTISPDKQWKFTASGWVPNTVSKPTPISVKEETPAGVLPSLPTLPTPETREGDLGNLRIALHSALTEAAQQTTKSRLQQMAGMGLLEGDVGSPSFIQAAIGLAQQGLRQTQETVFGDIMQTFQDQQNFALQLLGRYPDSTILPSDSPETAARKASRAPSFLKSLRGEPTVAEKEQGEARVSEAELERKRGEGGFVDLNEYRRMKARSLLSPTEFDKRFTYFLSDGDQERIRMENASPTTRTAGDFTKGEQVIQANLDYVSQVFSGQIPGASRDQAIAEMISIIQQETNLTESEIKQLIARFGFQKMGSAWVYISPSK